MPILAGEAIVNQVVKQYGCARRRRREPWREARDTETPLVVAQRAEAPVRQLLMSIRIEGPKGRPCAFVVSTHSSGQGGLTSGIGPSPSLR